MSKDIAKKILGKYPDEDFVCHIIKGERGLGMSSYYHKKIVEEVKEKMLDKEKKDKDAGVELLGLSYWMGMKLAGISKITGLDFTSQIKMALMKWIEDFNKYSKDDISPFKVGGLLERRKTYTKMIDNERKKEDDTLISNLAGEALDAKGRFSFSRKIENFATALKTIPSLRDIIEKEEKEIKKKYNGDLDYLKEHKTTSWLKYYEQFLNLLLNIAKEAGYTLNLDKDKEK